MTTRTLTVNYSFLHRRTSCLPIQAVILFQHSYAYCTKEDRMIGFEDYRKLRKRLKMRSRLAGIPAAAVGVTLSSALNIHLHPQMLEFQNPDLDPTPILIICPKASLVSITKQPGMDPLAFAVICGISSGIFGFIFGGASFNVLWTLLFKTSAQQLKKRENDFLRRLQQYRFSGINKFDDDYYGDKVNTLQDYRQWIRQQQRKKAVSSSPNDSHKSL